MKVNYNIEFKVVRVLLGAMVLLALLDGSIVIDLSEAWLPVLFAKWFFLFAIIILIQRAVAQRQFIRSIASVLLWIYVIGYLSMQSPGAHGWWSFVLNILGWGLFCGLLMTEVINLIASRMLLSKRPKR